MGVREMECIVLRKFTACAMKLGALSSSALNYGRHCCVAVCGDKCEISWQSCAASIGAAVLG